MKIKERDIDLNAINMDLAEMDDLLEPIKVASALRSEVMKMDYRKKHNPKDISILDVTILAALYRAIPQRPDQVSDGYADGNPVWDYLCPTCKHEFDDFDEYECCPDCGQRMYWKIDGEEK